MAYRKKKWDGGKKKLYKDPTKTKDLQDKLNEMRERAKGEDEMDDDFGFQRFGRTMTTKTLGFVFFLSFVSFLCFLFLFCFLLSFFPFCFFLCFLLCFLCFFLSFSNFFADGCSICNQRSNQMEKQAH